MTQVRFMYDFTSNLTPYVQITYSCNKNIGTNFALIIIGIHLNYEDNRYNMPWPSQWRGCVDPPPIGRIYAKHLWAYYMI